MPNDKRPKVGEADPETRRKKLREILDEPTRATGVSREKTKPETMREAVDAGVEMGSEDEMLPNGEKRRVKRKPEKKRNVVRRFGNQGKTENEMEDL